MKDQRRLLKAQAASLYREQRAEEKRRFRRMDRARGLNDEDLLAIVASRAVAKAKAKPKAKAKAKAKAVPKGAPLGGG